jgi:hypothetical protein
MVTATMLTSVALADGLTSSDLDDSTGGLDISSVRHAHWVVASTGQRLLRHRIQTFESWDDDVISDAHTHFYIYFNTDNDARVERRLWVDTKDGTLFARMEGPNEGGRVFGFAQIWKPRDDALIVQFPRALLGKSISRYRYYVESVFHDDLHPDCGTVDDMVFLCFDRAPEAGWLRHRLVAG